MARHDRYDIAKAITQNQSPIAIVEHYLELLMGPAPVAARAYISPDVVIRFTGGRMMHDPTENVPPSTNNVMPGLKSGLSGPILSQILSMAPMSFTI